MSFVAYRDMVAYVHLCIYLSTASFLIILQGREINDKYNGRVIIGNWLLLLVENVSVFKIMVIRIF